MNVTVPLIKSILKWTLAVLAVSVISAAVVLYFAHHRVVTRGEFLDLKIGETKEEVFLRLVGKLNVTTVAAMVIEDLIVNRANTNHLSKLADHEAFVVQGPKTHVRVYVTDSYISEIKPAYTGWQMDTVTVGDPIETAFPVIKEYLLKTPHSQVFTTIQDRGWVSVKEGVSVIDNPEFAWLKKAYPVVPGFAGIG